MPPDISCKEDLIQHRSVRATSYLFHAPTPIFTLILAPIMVAAHYAVFTLIWHEIYSTHIYIMSGAGSVLAPLVIHPLLMAIGRTTYLRRWGLLSVIVVAVSALSMGVIYLTLSPFFQPPIYPAFLTVLAFTIFYSAIIFRATSASNGVEAYMLAMIIPIFTLFPYMAHIVFIGMTGVMLLILTLVIAFLCIEGFFAIVSIPYTKRFGASPFELLQSSLEQFTTGGERGVYRMEEFLSNIGDDMEAEARIVMFDGEGRRPCALVIPNLHPGPYGRIGGSEMVNYIFQAFRTHGMDNVDVMVLHGASSHDQDPVRRVEVQRVADTIARNVLKALKTRLGSNNIGGPKTLKYKGMTFHLLRLDNALLVTFTSAPLPTDDVDMPVGKDIERALKERTRLRDVIFVDCHNSLKPGAGSVYMGSSKATALMEAVSSPEMGKVLEDIKTTAKGFTYGCGWSSVKGSGQDVGNERPLLTLITNTEGKKYAFVVIDGNNMVSGLRGRLRAALKQYVDDCEVLTTDTHAVNLKIGGYRPVGSDTPPNAIIKAALEATKKALNAAEMGGECRVRTLRGVCGRVRVLGAGRATELTEGVNRTIALLLPSYVLLNALMLTAITLVSMALLL